MTSIRSSLSLFWTCFPAFTAMLVWLLLVGGVEAQNTSSEVQTLLSFKQSFGLDITYWSNWKGTDENPCKWIGVTCTANYTVSELDLSGWGIRVSSVDFGVLANLGDLRRLDMSSSSLGNGLENICNLTGLTWLDLSQSGLNGTIPPCIAYAFGSMRFMSLQQNSLIGEIPSLSGLVSLQVLLLTDNGLSGPIPKTLGKLSSLSIVDLSNNAFNGSIPALQNLSNLVELKLDNNNFNAFEEFWSLGANSPIKYLSVSHNQLEGMIPSAITNLVNLTYLNMSNNLLSGSIPSGFSEQSELRGTFSLDLSQNRLVGEIPKDILEISISSAQNCPSLNLSHNLLHGGIPTGPASPSCFSSVDFSHNNLSGPIPLNTFSSTQSQVWLQNNRLSGDIVAAITGGGPFLRMAELRLQNNLFTGDLTRIAKYSGLQIHIEISAIDLSYNNMRWSTSEAIPDPITATMQTLTSITPLVEFRVGGNNFSGTSLPGACFVPGWFVGFQVLDLSNSHLKGELSGATFNRLCLPSLRFLNLSNNDITGPVPPDIVTIPSLQILDVSNNNLSGPLPDIPPYSSLFDPNIFAGNVGLCGNFLDPCPQFYRGGAGVQWWVLLVIIGGSLTIALGSCVVATWRWRVYRKMHQQDADLINTLLERYATTLMPLRELKKATDNFASSAQIGEGGFGTVYTGKLSDGTIVAIKRSKREGSDRDKEQFLNEVKILSQLNHRRLVKLLGCCMENKIALLVFEFVSNGTLQEHLQGKVGAACLSWKQRLNIAVQTANGLNYLHTEAAFPIYHRDVKSANILLNDDLDAKVADFGISKLAPLQATHVSTVAVQGTMGYIDPEYYTSYQLTDKSDVYSFGVVLLELISAKAALDFSRGGEDNSLVNLASTRIKSGDLEGLIDPALFETYNDVAGRGRVSILNVGRLAMKCVDMRSKARPSMNEVLKELQNLWLQLSGTSEHMDSITGDDHEERDEDDDEDLHRDHILLLSKSFSTHSFDLTIQSDCSCIQMSQFSGPPSFRSKSMG